MLGKDKEARAHRAEGAGEQGRGQCILNFPKPSARRCGSQGTGWDQQRLGRLVTSAGARSEPPLRLKGSLPLAGVPRQPSPTRQRPRAGAQWREAPTQKGERSQKGLRAAPAQGGLASLPRPARLRPPRCPAPGSQPLDARTSRAPAAWGGVEAREGSEGRDAARGWGGAGSREALAAAPGIKLALARLSRRRLSARCPRRGEGSPKCGPKATQLPGLGTPVEDWENSRGSPPHQPQ
ncbi:uncharacterized protein LOC130683260 [Manis pentadactyla]|uniref:uncharacterized protein LOC130683260 n=1 Tax=Manis pentadactyla TaxID=143292 RepID=UPI00255CD193|nr:uncharacterized protein LOC130683260 [Manis pentadactyla]